MCLRSVIMISFRRETICDALAQTEWRNFVSKFFSSPQMHARWQHQAGNFLNGEGGGVAHFYFLMLSPNLWSKIFPFTKRSGLRIFSMGGGGLHTFTFLLSPNLWSKIFPFTKRSGLRIFSMGGGGGGGLHTFTFWCWVQICGQKFFPLPSALDLEFS